MAEETIDSFIKKLQAISPDKRKLPLVAYAPNGLEMQPKIKMKFENDNIFSGNVEKMVIQAGD